MVEFSRRGNVVKDRVVTPTTSFCADSTHTETYGKFLCVQGYGDNIDASC